MAHTAPHTLQPPPSHMHQPSNGISKSSLNINAPTFVPTAPKSIVIRDVDGTILNLDDLKKIGLQPPIIQTTPSSQIITTHRVMSVRIESEETKRKREEQAVIVQAQKRDAGERAKKEEERIRRGREDTKREGRGGGGKRTVRVLNSSAPTFTPTSLARKPIVIRNEDGTVLDLEDLKTLSPQPLITSSQVVTSGRTVGVRIESEESKRKRARIIQEKKDAEERAKKEEERIRRGREEAKCKGG